MSVHLMSKRLKGVQEGQTVREERVPCVEMGPCLAFSALSKNLDLIQMAKNTTEAW